VAIAQRCRWFGVPRSTVYYRPPVRSAPRPPVVDTTVEAQIRTIIEVEPVAELRMITARVRRASVAPVNHKKIHRIVKLNNWQVRQRPQGHRSRVQGWASRATQPDERYRHDASLLRARWVVPRDRDHRLLRPGTLKRLTASTPVTVTTPVMRQGRLLRPRA
jgi:hypothetical protein